MYELTQKLFRITASCDRDPYDGCDYSHDISLEETCVGDILAGLSRSALTSHGYIKVGPNKGLSKEDIEVLKDNGWVHPQTIKSRNERRELEQTFWILINSKKGYYWEQKYEQVDLDNLLDHQIEALVNGGEIVQKVQIKSVLPEKAYKRYLTAKKNKEEQEEKKKLSAKKKQDQKKAKQIELAKKILQDAGEPLPD